jgi:hypothetical protein
MKARFHITDHALLRYLERVKGVDIEAARAEMHRTLAVGVDHEGLTGVRAGPFSFRIEDGSVTTVIRVTSRSIQTGGKRRELPE